MRFNFSIYAALTSAFVAVAVTTPTAAAAVDVFKLFQLPKEPLSASASKNKDLEIDGIPDLDAFDNGKRRHLTSSEDAPAPVPAPTPAAPTCPGRRLEGGDSEHRHLTSSEDAPPINEDPCPTVPTEAPVTVDPNPIGDSCDYEMNKKIRLRPGKTSTCIALAGLKIKKVERKCMKTRFINQCPGICDKQKCKCYNNNGIAWKGSNRRLTCSTLGLLDTARLVQACKKPRARMLCRGLCDPACNDNINITL